MTSSLGAKPVSQGVFFTLVAVFALSLLFSYHHNLNRGSTEPDDFLNLASTRKYVEHPWSSALNPKNSSIGYRPLELLYATLSVSWLRANPGLLLARNFILFLVCILLVFSIAIRLSSNRFLSLGASALFAFHPANVNAVSIWSGAYTAFCAVALLAVRLLIPVASEDVGRPARCLTSAWAAWLLAILLSFSAETFLWLLPVLALLFFRASRRTRSRTYLGLAALSLALLFGQVLLRFLLLNGTKTLTPGTGEGYGLKTPLMFLANLVSQYAGFGSIVDHVLLFNPVDQALPRSATGLLHLPGVAASLALSGFVSAVVLLWSLAAWPQARNNDVLRTRAPLVFVFLSLCSVSVVSVGVLASETYLLMGNALWSIAAILLVGSLLGKARGNANLAIATAGIVALVMVILLRMAGTANRNRILADKAQRIGHLQSELRAAAGDFRGRDLYLVPDSQFPRGYSVYGGRSLSMVPVQTFACVTLNRYDMRAHEVAIESLPSLHLTSDDEHRVLIVDIEGNVRKLPGETRQQDSGSSPWRMGVGASRSEYVLQRKRSGTDARR